MAGLIAAERSGIVVHGIDEESAAGQDTIVLG
jgi:hypothetical protein